MIVILFKIKSLYIFLEKLLLTKDGQELDADLFLEDNRLYFTIKDYLEKMYYMDVNDMSNMEEKNDIEIDVDALIKILKD